MPLRPARRAFRGRTGGGPPGSAVPRSSASRAAPPKALHGCAWKTGNASGCEKPPEEALVDFAQRFDRAQIHVLIELVDRGVHRTELDHLWTEFGDEAAVGRAARRADLRGGAGDVPDRSAQGLDQFPPGSEIGRPGKRPTELVIEPVAIEYRSDACFQSFRRARRGKAEIEQDFHLAWNDVGRPGSAVNVRDLPGRGWEVFVAPVPFGCGEVSERTHRQMDWILRKMRISHMPLHASHPQCSGERAAPAVLDRVTQPG